MRTNETFDPSRHRLVRHVSARHPDTGYTHSFAPGDDVPDWAAAVMTNPDIWENTDSTGAQPAGPPPTSGGGSNRDVWATYAEAHGITVTEDDKRDNIIAKLNDAGIPTTRE